MGQGWSQFPQTLTVYSAPLSPWPASLLNTRVARTAGQSHCGPREAKHHQAPLVETDQILVSPLAYTLTYEECVWIKLLTFFNQRLHVFLFILMPSTTPCLSIQTGRKKKPSAPYASCPGFPAGSLLWDDHTQPPLTECRVKDRSDPGVQPSVWESGDW